MRTKSVSRVDSRSDAIALEAVAHREARRRGIQGFLTWSFFLSSIIAVDKSLGIGGSRAADDADPQPSVASSTSDVQFNSLDWSPAAAANSDASNSDDRAHFPSLDLLDPTGVATDNASEFSPIARQSLDFGAAQSWFGGDGSGIGIDGSATLGEGETPQVSIDSTGQPLGLTIDLGLDPLDLDGIGLDLGASLPLGIDLGLGLGLQGVGLDLQLGSQTDIQIGIQTNLLAGDGLLPNVLGSVEPTVAALASPVTEVLSGPVGIVSELATLRGLVVSGDALPLTSVLTSLPGLNELFSGTEYSNYGIALQSAALDAPKEAAGDAADDFLQSLNSLADQAVELGHADQGKAHDPLHDELHLKTLGGGGLF